MRITSFSCALFAAGALCIAACDPDDAAEDSGTTVVQNPGQTGYDAAVPGQDGAVISPLPDAGGSVPGFDAGQTGQSDSGVVVGNPSDASAPEAAAPGDGGTPAPSEAGAGGYSPCPGGGMPCKILPLGDSITYGLDSQQTSTGSYRVELFNKAKAAGKNITFVGTLKSGPMRLPDGTAFPQGNEGYSGQTISQIADKVPSPALNDKPHIALLMIGTNDMSFGDLGAVLGFGDLAGAPTRLGMLVDELVGSDPNMLVVVAKITPRSSGNGDTEAYNSALAGEVERRASQGKHVLLVDMYTGFPSDGLSDPVHPNKKGYDWMAGVWYKAIESVLR